ncbi:MAG: YegS/Rv2252/BmrU family lipid kinase [Bacteroidetes bacterium]|nr:YegS/Rv2252/BmrU family lipid kinase [Bacteroidota bacterium]
MKQKIIIIYNPVSGAKRGVDIPALVEKYIDKEKFDYLLWSSESAEHMIELSKKASRSDAEIIVAAGGDGSANTVSHELVNSNKRFYLFPLGSGNGFARHFGIPMKIAEAIRSLGFKSSETIVSTATMNDLHFINVAGVGFDAHISHVFAQKNQRGFWGYIKAVIKELGYKSHQYNIQNGSETWQGKAFLISVANATQWGNNIKIAPHANPEDKILDLVAIKKFRLIEAPIVMFCILSGKIKNNRYFYLTSGAEITIERECEAAAHVDGEPVMAGKTLVFSCKGNIKLLS